MIYAIIPAAGQSTRMGRPKLLLPVGGRTVLEQVITTIKKAGVQDVLVVFGPHQKEYVPIAAEALAHVIVLAQPTGDMRETVQGGLAWYRHKFDPDPTADQWLLCPADHPTLNGAVVRRLAQMRKNNPAKSIVLPTYEGKRGHPVLVDWKHSPGLRMLPHGQGINVYLRQQAAETLEVPVDTPDILIDLDTPEDYEKLLKRMPKRDVGEN
jgi:molybdenum cofactor cytidylyltransferase